MFFFLGEFYGLILNLYYIGAHKLSNFYAFEQLWLQEPLGDEAMGQVQLI